jgi:hypothetical protein
MKRCAHCGGRFGLIVYRWYGQRFCRAKCRERFLQELDEKRMQLKRWLNFIGQPVA